MPIWLVKYWKPLAALGVFIAYSLTVNNWAVSRTNDKWEVKEASRIEAELKAEIKASGEAEKLKAAQDKANAEAMEKLREAKEAAEARAKLAQQEANNQRRLNNESTKELERIQASSNKPAQPIADDGVRDIIRTGQDKVRSRRQP